MHPSLSTGRLHPRLPPSSQLPQWGVLESKGKTPCNVKISDCLPPVTEDTHLCSRKLEIRKIFPCFLQHIFAQSLISLLIFGVFFSSYILSQFFFYVLSFVYCAKVLQVCFDRISSTSQHANYFFYTKNNILMCGSMPCFKHLLQKYV